MKPTTSWDQVDREMGGKLLRALVAWRVEQGLSLRAIADQLHQEGYEVSHHTVDRWLKGLGLER